MLTLLPIFVRCHQCGVALGETQAHDADYCRDCAQVIEAEAKLRLKRNREKRRRANYSALRRRWLKRLIRRQRYLCGVCRNLLPVDVNQVEIDHIVPVSRMSDAGMSRTQLNHPNNLQAVHPLCNKIKSDSMAHDPKPVTLRMKPLF